MKELQKIESFDQLCESQKNGMYPVLVNSDLSKVQPLEFKKRKLKNTYFFGKCQLPKGIDEDYLIKQGAIIVKPCPSHLPFLPFRET